MVELVVATEDPFVEWQQEKFFLFGPTKGIVKPAM